MTTTAAPSATTATHDTAAAEERQAQALVERLFGAFVGGMELLSIDLGRRLGLYQTIREHGPVTSRELAARAAIAERYAREWLEQQAVAGILDVDSDGAPASRGYSLSVAYAAVLVDEEHPAYFIGTAPCLTGLALTVPAVADAYRTGGGVAYADYGTEIREGIGMINRPMFVNELADGWLTALPDVCERLLAEGGHVLDLGCGQGWSTIAIARAFPKARVVGIDLDEASIADARTNAEQAGVADRVTFELRNATQLEGAAQRYDLACAFETLHDMGEPVAVLRGVRGVLREGAPLLVADERVADDFTAPGDEVERFMYGWSALHCLPATMDESNAVANGTVLRASTVREWGTDAGFATVEVLPIDNDFWRFYRFDA